uniref:Uncharacterized protein n=1 Tax=Brassica oleracea TaxID=3712 RepID=A0A3P6BTX4_BRAOL|nr:unnamed protein product [Brassica oleracea]
MLPLIFESRTTSPQKVMLQSIKSIKGGKLLNPQSSLRHCRRLTTASN